MNHVLRALGIGLYINARSPNNTDAQARELAVKQVNDEYFVVTDKMRAAFDAGMDTAAAIMLESEQRRERISEQATRVAGLEARVVELDALLLAARPEPTPEDMGVEESAEESEPASG